jgi:hypothetical protein
MNGTPQQIEAEKIRANPRFRQTVQSLIAFSMMDIPADNKAMEYL